MVRPQYSCTAPNCRKHFHWLMGLFLPIRFDITIVSIGNNCNVKPDWPESPLGTVVKSNLIGQNQPINEGNPLYNWMLDGNCHLCESLRNILKKNHILHEESTIDTML